MTLDESYLRIGKRLVQALKISPQAIWIQDWTAESCRLADAIQELEVPVATFKLHGPHRQQLQHLEHLEFLVTQESNEISLSLLADRCREAGRVDFGCRLPEFHHEDNGQLESRAAG